MGCLQHAVIFIAVTHDACGPVADPDPNARSHVQFQFLIPTLLAGPRSCVMPVTHIARAQWP